MGSVERSMHVFLHSLVATLAMTIASVPAYAQTPRADRPYRGLFGSSSSDFGQLLTVSGSVGGGWDNNLIADARGLQGVRLSDLNTNHRGGVGTVSASLAYELARDRWNARASAGSAGRYYPSLRTD